MELEVGPGILGGRRVWKLCLPTLRATQIPQHADTVGDGQHATPLQITLSSWGPGEALLALLQSLAGSVGCALGRSFRDLDGFGGDGWGFCPVIKMSVTPRWGPIFRGNFGAMEACSKEQSL